MAERTIDPRLQELYDKGIPVYSISRLNTIHQCPYQAYLNYVKHVPAPGGNVWSYLGGKCHDALEETLHGADESVVLKAINEELEDLDIADVDFPLDRNGNPSIRNNWIKNMHMFANNYKRLDGKFETEQLILVPINGGKQYMQGYIDVIKHNDDGSVDVLDWKTSSQFTKDHLIEAGRQLVLYAIAMEQQGYRVNRICWYMLKYAVTSWQLKNGKTKEKVSEWRNMISDLKSPIDKALTELGYDEVDIECMIQEGIDKNSWEVFPQEIRDKFTTKPYVREYEFSEENKAETMKYIEDTIASFEERGEDENNWESCNIDKQSFFCSSLCSFGGKTGLCKYWVDYCDSFSKESNEDEEEDLF